MATTILPINFSHPLDIELYQQLIIESNEPGEGGPREREGGGSINLHWERFQLCAEIYEHRA